MQPLALPSGGPVYLDTNAVIYSVELVEPYSSLLQPLWVAAGMGQFIIVSSQALIPETLIRVIRQEDRELERRFREVLNAAYVDLLAADRRLWEAAASIGGPANLSTLDALHAATALAAGCSLFVTNDTDFRRVPGLPAVILDDYA